MIITCINCEKKFNVKSELIPDEGRTIQCGSCNHIWFFKKNNQVLDKEHEKDPFSENKPIKSVSKKEVLENIDYSLKKKGSEIIKYDQKSNFTFAKILSYILVAIISFISLIIILDTFKSSLYNLFPNLEFFLFSLYETLKDIELFIKDLI